MIGRWLCRLGRHKWRTDPDLTHLQWCRRLRCDTLRTTPRPRQDTP